MKKYLPLFIAIVCAISISSFAQPNERIPEHSGMDNMDLLAVSIPDNGLVPVSYHVEERINMNFGSRVVTYNVPTLSMVSTKNLGPNNVRIITPKYAKVAARDAAVAITAVNIEQSKVALINTTELFLMRPVVIAKKPKYVNIDILSTYERVLDKGYDSVDLLKRVGNGRFFDGDLTVAAKWYAKLFDLTTDLEAEYYYRYAQSLKSISQIEKANEMMRIFETKNL